MVTAAPRLAQHSAGRFGIPLRLIPEPLACAVDLNAPFDEDRPSDQNAVRMRHVYMPLIGLKMRRLGPDFIRPKNHFTAVPIMPKPKRIRDLRHMLGHQSPVPTKTVARKDQPVAANPLDAAFGGFDLHTLDRSVFVKQ